MPQTSPASIRPALASAAATPRDQCDERLGPWPLLPGATEVLLAAVAHAAEVLTATPDLRAALAEAGRVLGEAAGVDRVNVFRYDHAQAAGFLYAEWARPGVAPVGAVDPGPYAYADYAEVWRPLMAGAVCHSPLTAKTGANAALNAALNAATHVKTDLFVPVLVDGAFWGALNLDDCTTERAWTDGEVEVLRAGAAAVAAAVRREALERERAQVAEARAAELARANDALQAVTDALAEARGLDEIVPTVLGIAARTFGVEAGGFFEHRDDTAYLRHWLHEGRVLPPAELLALDPVGRHAVPRRLAGGFTRPIIAYADGRPTPALPGYPFGPDVPVPVSEFARATRSTRPATSGRSPAAASS